MQFDYVVVPFDQIFTAVREGRADVGLIIHEGQLTFAKEGLELCADLGVWWGEDGTDGVQVAHVAVPADLGGGVGQSEDGLNRPARAWDWVGGDPVG